MSPFPVRAVVLGVAGATLGSILWVLIAIAGNLERSFPAILVGVFAGILTRIVPRRGRPAQIVTSVATVIGMIVVQYFVVRHAMITDQVDLGLNRSTDVFLSPAAMWRVTFGWLRVYPLDIVPWVVSATAGFALPAGGAHYLSPSSAFLAPEADG